MILAQEYEELAKPTEELNREWEKRKHEAPHSHPSHLVIELLEGASRKLEGFGVESLLDEENWQQNFESVFFSNPLNHDAIQRGEEIQKSGAKQVISTVDLPGLVERLNHEYEDRSEWKKANPDKTVQDWLGEIAREIDCKSDDPVGRSSEGIDLWKISLKGRDESLFYDYIDQKFMSGTTWEVVKQKEREHEGYLERLGSLAERLNNKLHDFKDSDAPNMRHYVTDLLAVANKEIRGDGVFSAIDSEKGVYVRYVDKRGDPFIPTILYDGNEGKFLAGSLDAFVTTQIAHETRTSDMQESAAQGTPVFGTASQDEARLQDTPEPDAPAKQNESMPVKSILDDLDWPKPRSKSEELRQDFTKKIIGLMEQGEAPWQRPWKLPPSCMPVNAVSGKRYNGSNIAYLMIAGMDGGYSDPRWVTYKQAQEQGWQVRKGEHGTKIEYYSEYDPTKTKKGEEQLNERIRDMMVTGASPERIQEAQEGYKTGYIKHYTVFNAAQIEGIPPLEIEPVIKDFEPNERAESIMDNCGVSIEYGSMGAFYSPELDRIKMPDRELFNDESHFYATALHEIAHSTGHSSRLNREEGMKSRFGSQEYAKEELRAEMASLFINAGIGLVVTEEGMEKHTEQHAAYAQHWLKTLKDDYREFFRATRDANKIADHVLAYEKERIQTEERETVRDHDTAEPATEVKGIETNEAARGIHDTSEESIQASPGSEQTPNNLPFEPEIGRRVTFQPHDGKAKLTGIAKEIDENQVVLQCGRTEIPVLREKGTFTEAPELDRTETAKYARERAQRHIGENGGVFVAGGRGTTYRGAIAEITPGYAIQKIGENAVLHRLKDLQAHRDAIREGTEVCIARSSKGELTVEPHSEQGKRERERQDNGQSR
jgi:antirestriction protein ArdC